MTEEESQNGMGGWMDASTDGWGLRRRQRRRGRERGSGAATSVGHRDVDHACQGRLQRGVARRNLQFCNSENQVSLLYHRSSGFRVNAIIKCDTYANAISLFIKTKKGINLFIGQFYPCLSPSRVFFGTVLSPCLDFLKIVYGSLQLE